MKIKNIVAVIGYLPEGLAKGALVALDDLGTLHIEKKYANKISIAGHAYRKYALRKVLSHDIEVM